MKPILFRTMLDELNPEEAAETSVLNHHVDGMDYLCLHRSEKLTVKLYFIDTARIAAQHGMFLVTPHTHRYAFESTVLAGTLTHELFEEDIGDAFDRSVYSPETRTRVSTGVSGLRAHSSMPHTEGSSYWVGTKDIHTLIVPIAPVLLGLIQFADTVATSTVYVRKSADMKYPVSRKPTPLEVFQLRNKAIEMMEAK